MLLNQLQEEVNIPIQDEAPTDLDIKLWLDTNEENDQFYTTQQVDELLDNLTYLDVGAAPAGYGLGELSKLLTSADDLNNIWKNGWYCWLSDVPANAPTRPNDGAAYAVCTMFVQSVGIWGNGYYLRQTVRIYTYGDYNKHSDVARTIVVAKDGTASYQESWEYIDPPMIIGEEYRTTERYMGKPVYIKAFKVAIPTTANTFAGEEYDISHVCFDISATIVPNNASGDIPSYRYSLPTAGGDIVPIIMPVLNGNKIGAGVRRMTTGQYTDYHAIVVVKFIKK